MKWNNLGDLTAMNVLAAIIGAILFIAPWAFGFGGTTPAWDAWIVGVVVAVVAIAAVAALKEWEIWICLVAGLWLILAPWVLAFSTLTVAVWTHVVLGLILAVLCAFELWLIHSTPTRKVA
jgi:SPW repeat-containing protein